MVRLLTHSTNGTYGPGIFLHMVHQVKSISTIGFRVELQKSLELHHFDINRFKSKTTVVKSSSAHKLLVWL